MEFHLELAQHRPDLGIIRDALQTLDPAAVADTDASRQRLRVATWLHAQDVAWALRRAGLPVWEQDLVKQPSVCCGGCSG